MRVFDDIVRTYHEPANYGESEYDFLNRSARPAAAIVREEIEKWFSSYPTEHKKELRSRFRAEPYSPFFELLLHEIFRQLGATVEIHPEAGTKGKRPEFLAKFGEEQCLAVEATVSNDEDTATRGHQKRLAAIYDAIDRIDSPHFFLSVHRVKEEAGKQVAPRRVVAFINRELAKLDPVEVLNKASAPSELPNLVFQDGASRIEFRVIPKRRDAWGGGDSRLIGMRVRSRWGGGEDSLLLSLARKAKHYGEISSPFLVAVSTLGHWRISEEDRLAALFGKTQEYVQVATGEVGVRNLGNGIWGCESNPKYTRVSCVLIGVALPWNVPRIDFCLYLNPWAKQPLFEIALPFRVAQFSSEGVSYVDPIVSIGELLGLPDNWPGPLFDQ